MIRYLMCAHPWKSGAKELDASYPYLVDFPVHSDERGDLYARVTLVLPDPLSEAEVETLRTLQQARQPATSGRS